MDYIMYRSLQSVRVGVSFCMLLVGVEVHPVLNCFERLFGNSLFYEVPDMSGYVGVKSELPLYTLHLRCSFSTRLQMQPLQDSHELRCPDLWRQGLR